LGKDRASPAVRKLVRQLAEVVGNRQDRAETAGVIALLDRGADSTTGQAWQAEVLLGLARGAGRRGKSFDSILPESKTNSTALLRRFLAEARTTVADGLVDTSRREQAAELLGLGSLKDAREPLTNMLDPKQPASLQLAAIRVLSSFNDADVPGILLAGWRMYSPAVRAEVVQALL